MTARLAEAAASLVEGATGGEAFLAAFAVAPVFAPRPAPPARPGLVAVGPPGAGRVLVFSSLQQLARVTGECDWLRTSGADLLGLVADGYGVLLDAGSAHALELPATALNRPVDVAGEGGRT